MSVKSSGTHEPRRRFARTGRQLFQHRLTGARELRQRVRPVRAASFQHRLSGVRELPQAGSPLTGGEFSAEPQRGIRRLRTAGTCRAPRRGQKGRDTCGFPSSLNSYLSLGESGADCLYVTASKKENGRGFFLCYGRTTFGVRPLEQPIRRVRYRSATHVVYSTQARHDSAAQSVSLEFTHGTCECRCSVAFIFVGAFQYNA